MQRRVIRGQKLTSQQMFLIRMGHLLMLRMVKLRKKRRRLVTRRKKRRMMAPKEDLRGTSGRKLITTSMIS
jgi:hypothetical protein